MLTLSQAQPFGDFADDLRRTIDAVGKIAQRIPQYLDTMVDVLEDPALPLVVSRMKTIKRLRQQAKSTTSSTLQPQKTTPGVGLEKAVPVLDAYIYTQEHKWVTPLAIALLLTIPLGIGFAIGRISKRS